MILEIKLCCANAPYTCHIQCREMVIKQNKKSITQQKIAKENCVNAHFVARCITAFFGKVCDFIRYNPPTKNKENRVK